MYCYALIEKYKLLYIFSLLFFHTCTFGQSKVLIEKVTIEDGLSQNLIYDLYQDELKFIWIGTKDGLNRYDGFDFKVFNYSFNDRNSISSNYVTEILEDDSSNLWLGTKAGGLNFYDRSENRFYNYKVNPKGTVSSITISTLARDSKQNLLIGTQNNGAYTFNVSGQVFQPFQLGSIYSSLNGISSISKIKEDKAGNILISTYGAGFFIYNFENKSYTRFDLSLAAKSNQKANRIFTFFQSDSIVWLGTRFGLIKLNLLNAKQERYIFIQSDNDTAKVHSIIPAENNLKEGGSWEVIGFVQGHGTTNSPKSYSFTDLLNLNPNLTRLDYRLKQIDNDGTFAYSKVVTVDLTNITSVDDQVKYEFALEQNYPNPFNPSTTIKFTVPSVETGHAPSLQTTLLVYDILGREVATLVNQKFQPGNHEIFFDASNLSSGMYIYIKSMPVSFLQ